MTARLHHTAIAVADLDRSIDFYRRFFGAEVAMRQEAEGPDVAQLHGLAQARFEFALLRFGAEACLEVFAFEVPPEREGSMPRACDIGGTHFCLEVNDVTAAYRLMTEEGVQFTREPMRIGGATGPGFVLAFCIDPDGYRVELLQQTQAG